MRDGSGLLFADSKLRCIRFIHAAARKITTVAGAGAKCEADGDGLDSAMEWPRLMTFDASSAVPDSVVYITTSKRLWRLDMKTGQCLCVEASHAFVLV
jgi:hypothetical protein